MGFFLCFRLCVRQSSFTFQPNLVCLTFSATLLTNHLYHAIQCMPALMTDSITIIFLAVRHIGIVMDDTNNTEPILPIYSLWLITRPHLLDENGKDQSNVGCSDLTISLCIHTHNNCDRICKRGLIAFPNS